MNVAKKIKSIDIYRSVNLLSGLGQEKTKPIGFFTAYDLANQLFIQKFLVVPDNVVDCGALLGHDFTRKFIFCCDDNGFKLTGLRVEPKELDVLDADVYNFVEV